MGFFVDSCIFIESFKSAGIKEASSLLELILRSGENFSFYVNAIVESEVIYLLTFRKKSKSLLSLREIGSVLDAFEFLAITEEIRKLYRELMMKHNLKPNDALILATCKFYGISHLISLDMDFKVSCEKEGIKLIDSREKLKKALNMESSGRKSIRLE